MDSTWTWKGTFGCSETLRCQVSEACVPPPTVPRRREIRGRCRWTEARLNPSAVYDPELFRREICVDHPSCGRHLRRGHTCFISFS